jgi:ribosome biogenesis GTPase A
MAIQWFPGHMHATRKAIAARIKEIDVVIELLDARLPGSSSSPMLAELTAGKPALKILNKQDLADPTRTALWLAHFNIQPATRAIGMSAGDPTPAKMLIQASCELAPNRRQIGKPMRVLMCGVPNVGKSTLINTMLGRKTAKTGDEAGVTKVEQRFSLDHDFYLFDTPGILWPRITAPQIGFNLAASGAVGRNAFDEPEVAVELLAILKTDYPALLATRYDLEDVANRTDEDLLEAIGRRRGAIKAGQTVSYQKAAEMVIYDFRQAAMGRITLETPEQYLLWLKEGLEKDAERTERKAQYAADRKKSFKREKTA